MATKPEEIFTPEELVALRAGKSKEDSDKEIANLIAGIQKREETILNARRAELQGVRKTGSDGMPSSSDVYGTQPSDTADRPLFYCSTKKECDEYGKEDILNELLRRGYTVAKGGATTVYTERNEAIQRGLNIVSTSEFLKSGDGKTFVAVPALEDQDSMDYINKGKNAIDKDGQKRYVKVTAEVNEKTTKPQLIKVLLNSHKREDERRRRMMKMKSKYGSMCATQKSLRGALPSETTNPSMYDFHTGLLKTEFLTQDHVGVIVPDALGNKFRVEWTPFPNGKGRAYWVPVNKSATNGGPVQAMYLVGDFVLDKRGLPLITQLNYWEHRGKVAADRDGTLWQVVCKNRKNKKDRNIGTMNCPMTKCGDVAIMWERYDATVGIVDMAEGAVAADKKFNTPMGIYSYDQLMKLNLDDILKMMIVLELMEEGPKYADKMKAMGLKPNEPMVSVPGRGAIPLSEYVKLQGTEATLGVTKKHTTLTPQQRMFEEALYDGAGMGKCQFPNPGIRCYSDSYIPGTCVPDEEICFKNKYRGKYLNDLNNKGKTGKMQWAIDKSENIAAGAIPEAEYAKVAARLAKEGPKNRALALALETKARRA